MIQLQSVLFPVKGVCEEKDLYYHQENERIDFDGYFNLFYIEKRKKYTQIKDLHLRISACGYKALVLVHDGIDLKTIQMDSKQEAEYLVKLPYEQYETGVFWFALIEDKAVENRHAGGMFVSEISEELCRSINLGIDICTFKRETYVERNLRQLKEKILDNKALDVSGHVGIYIIDNGKTLHECAPVQELLQSCAGRAKVFRNKNAGGAGGFTRGMIEILKEKEKQGFTHVLLMDDDAIVEPDTLVRIYGFLATAKEEWKDITIGGAMLLEEEPHILFCAGEWWEKGNIINSQMYLDLNKRENSTCAYLTETGQEYSRYSGWWCCCYSLNTVREDNLPIPLFIHHDDIEFGLRNRGKGIVFLNGIGVWHRGPGLVFPGANLYYDIRNNLIELALHQKSEKKKNAYKVFIKAFIVAAIRMKYKDARMVYRGMLDFLKGPGWLHDQEASQLNNEIRSMTYAMEPLEALKGQLTAEEYEAVQNQIQSRKKNFGLEERITRRTKKNKATWLHYATFNGWLLPADKKGIKVIFSTDSPFETFRKKKVVLYEPGSNKAVLIEKQYKELFKLIGAFLRALWAFSHGFDAAVRDYEENIQKITNQKAWEEYLKET